MKTKDLITLLEHNGWKFKDTVQTMIFISKVRNENQLYAIRKLMTIWQSLLLDGGN
jgi:hypothetical protein